MKYLVFAQAYGEGTYGECDYSSQHTAACAAGGANTSGGNPNSGLANTGIDLLVIATGACLLIFAGLLVRFWRRKPIPKENT